MIENIVEYLQNLTKRDIKPGVYTTLQFPDSLTILEILHAIGKKLGGLFSDTKITTTTTTTSGGDADVQVTGDVNSLHFDFTIPAGGGGGGSGDVTAAGNNRFTGKNTFVQSPNVPTPTNVGDATNKAYVDTESDAASADAVGKSKEYTNGEVERLDGKISNEINALDGRVETLEDSVTEIETKQATDEGNIQTNANDIEQLATNQAALQESVQQLQNGTLNKMATTGTVGQYWRKSKTGDAGEWQDGDGGGGGESTSTLAWLPDVDTDGNLSWSQSTTTTPPETRNIKGADGQPGAPGQTGPQGPAGTDGFSPTAKVTQTDTGATISITDKDGTTTATVTNGTNGTDGAPGDTGPQGPAGTDGYSPKATVTQTDTGATISITDKDGTTTATVTNGTNGTDGAPGDTGPQGPAGADGVSPKATVTQTETGATISITDKDGTTTANITNGTNGTDGAPGDTGPQGPAGVGVPTGGTSGQVLAKKSDTDYDTEWVNQSGGGGGGGNVPDPPAYANRYLRTTDTSGTLGWGTLPSSSLTNVSYATYNQSDYNLQLLAYDADGAHLNEQSYATYQMRMKSELSIQKTSVIGGATFDLYSIVGDLTFSGAYTTYAGGYVTLKFNSLYGNMIQGPFLAELYNGDVKVSDAEIGDVSKKNEYIKFPTPTSFQLSQAKIKLKIPLMYAIIQTN